MKMTFIKKLFSSERFSWRPTFYGQTSVFQFRVIVEPFLKKYQTDQPMILFLYCDLEDIIVKLLNIIVEYEIIEKCKKWKTVD